MKERILQLLEMENLTALKFAEIMEVRPSNISHILSGRNNPGFEFISRLLLRFPEINPDWFINGIGSMYRVEPETSISVKTSNIPDNVSDTQMSTLFHDPNYEANHEQLIVGEPEKSVADETSQVDVAKQDFEQPVVNPNDDINVREAGANQIIGVPAALAPNISNNDSHNVSNANDDESQNPSKGKINENVSKSAEYQATPEQIIVFYDDNTFKLYTHKK